MRIAVIGNCQAAGVAASMRRMVPGAQVESYELIALRNGSPDRDPEEIARRISRYDAVFTQKHDLPQAGPLRTSRLLKRMRHVELFPAVSFDGLHPDATYISRDAEHLHSPVGAYHSALVAGAFLAGVPVGRVAGLFNAYVYGVLGYYPRYDAARSFLAELGGRVGFDLDGCIADWQATGAWMHTINHPHIRVLFSVARIALDKAGIPYDRTATADGIEDNLARDSIWPIYPELAHRLGVEGGSLVFTKGLGRCKAGEAREIGLDAFIEQSYAVYSDLPRSVLEATRAVAEVAARLTVALDRPANATPPGERDPQDGLAESFILALYRALLGRDPDPAGLQAWVSQVRNRGLAEAFETSIRSFCASAEGRQRLREIYIDPA
jgi:Polysaccharide biosynthesis enzyme WcbI/Domain of unknown function (DUF4214)